jgi:methylated-DNA-[protein]-cysteine S-methyltransferase
MALLRAGGRVLALTFGQRSASAALRALERRQTAVVPVDRLRPSEDLLVQRLCDFADGVPVDFDDWEVETEGLTDFGRQVIAACRKIPWGTTCTYGQLAELAGRPGAARAVGSAMARNRVPLVVPCHRVVPATGGLGGFSAPQGVAMKRRLLQSEQRAGALWR